MLGRQAALAQLSTATISGVVKDPSGAVVPDVTVTVTSTETGMSRTATTASNGSYRFPALPVGNYELRAEHPGFRAQVQSGLRVTVAEEAVLNFTLEIGAVTETVSVTAEAPLVNTTSGSLSSLVSEQRVADLPLDGRNFNDLTMLQIGVAQNRTADTSGGLQGTMFSSNGAPIRSNLFMIDGTIMNDLMGSGGASTNENSLGIEGIREFRVVTNSFSAEYGISMGSQITLATKSGTNHLHGSVFEYLRNSALDARNWTDIPTKPSFRRNNFGAAGGGPLRPDRTFFYLVYEGLRQTRNETQAGAVPTLQARQDGGLVPRIAEPVKPYLALFPLPNGPDLGQGLGRFFNPVANIQGENFGQGRVDHSFSASDSLFGRYTIDDAFEVRPGVIPPFRSDLKSKNQWLTVSENHVFTPALLNTFRASFSRTHSLSIPTGVNDPALSFSPGQIVGELGISGLADTRVPGTVPLDNNQRIISFSDDVFYTRGRHALKFGTLINLYRQFLLVGTNIRGAWRFANLASFLEGRATQFQVMTPGSRYDRTYDFSTLGFYVQDDLRVTPTFTLNVGLRYEFTTQFEEIRGNGAALRDIQRDPAVTLGIPFLNPSRRNLGPRFGFAWDIQGDGKTALRGGFGLLYDIGTFGSALLVGTTGTPPLSSQAVLPSPTFRPLPPIPPEAAGRALRTVDYNMQQPHLLSYNLTLERQLPFAMGLTVAYAGSRGLNIMRTREGNPRVPEVLPDGRKFWTGREPRVNPNWADIEWKTADGNSWYNSLQVGLLKRLTRNLQFQSSYTWSHALDESQGQLSVEDGPVAGGAGSNYGEDAADRSHDKGSASFDLRHIWRVNAIYRFPWAASGAWGKLANGWWVSSIFTWNSGFPFLPTLGSQRSRSGYRGVNAGANRPDLVPGVKHEDITRGRSRGCLGFPAGTPLGTPERFFDPCAFSIPPLGFLGTAGRYSVYGPNFSNLTFSLVKDTKLPFLGESGTLQFRAETFNVLNHPSFGPPQRTVFAALADVEPPLSNVGNITSTLSKSREIQFAVKILF